MKSISTFSENSFNATSIFLGDNGFSDPSAGVWDSNLRIGTLTTDITSSIEIINDKITLDGNGHKIYNCDNGVLVSNKNHITIKNLIFETHFNNIIMLSSNNSKILNNVSFDSEGGIFLNKCTNADISNNLYYGNKLLVGLNLFNCRDTAITHNYVDHARDFGVILETCYDIHLSKNTVSNCNFSILSEGGASNNISSNLIENGSFGIQVKGTDNCCINNNCLYEPTVIGLYSDASNYSSITNNSFHQCKYCIEIFHCSGCTIDCNLLKADDYGINMTNCSNLTVINNNILFNNIGVIINNSSSNIFQYNSLAGKRPSSSIGLFISDKSLENNIYNNNFIKNNPQAIDRGTNNHFYDSKPIYGNYWSDLSPSSCGKINKTPYCFENNIDLYPWNYPDGWLC